MVSVMKKVSKK